MSVFEILKIKYKNQFNKVFKKLNYQMLYHEAVILLNYLEGREPSNEEYELKWRNKFEEYLSK